MIFADAAKVGYEGYSFDYYETSEKSRDRWEIRRHWTIACSANMDEYKEPWKKLNIIGMVESERTSHGKTSLERRYYISSIENNATLFGQSVRRHWGVENDLHWCLDMGFREDESRIRKGHSAENFATMRHIAMNILKQEKSIKLGIKNKRLVAGWDESYLAKLLSNS